jgi:hypothetical protein
MEYSNVDFHLTNFIIDAAGTSISSTFKDVEKKMLILLLV